MPRSLFGIAALAILAFLSGCTTKTEVVALQPEPRPTVIRVYERETRTRTVQVKKRNPAPSPAAMEVVNSYDQ